MQQQNCYQYIVQANKEESTLGPLKLNKVFDKCENIIPSLFYPILILPQSYSEGIRIEKEEVKIKNPFMMSEVVGSKFYLSNIKFLNDFEAYFIKFDFINNYCYFGLSIDYSNYTSGLKENEVLLSCLKEKEQKKNIFSFSKFNLNGNLIETTLYFGEDHNDFTSNNGIIGSSKLNEEDNLWGFSFNEIIINNNINETISLKRTKDNKLYKIYLTTEEYLISFPIELITSEYINEKFFDNKCKFSRNDKWFKCNNAFNGKDYIPLKLVSNDINITLELDNFKRYYSKENNDNEEIIRIDFIGEDYIIFPLIMFKQFHVQFDAEKKVINFYTEDSSILQVKEEKKKETPNNEEDSSSGLTIFLVILIILLVIGIGLGVFYFLVLRRNKIEKDINRFTKFEDEEDFKNMNENKVY